MSPAMNRDPYDTKSQETAPLGRFKGFALLVLMSLAVYGMLSFCSWGVQALFDSGAEAVEVAPRGNLAEDEQSTIELFRQSSPSVVHIRTDLAYGRVSRNPMEMKGTGSGFVWGGDGYIVTNYHVVARGNSWSVTLANGATRGARLVGYMASFDLAVLKIEAPSSQLRAVRVGSSHDLLVGQKVFAIGNPFGLDHSLSTGVISGLGRSIRGYGGYLIEDVIQTDAAINPGNSGGPLFDSSARLVGVNTAIVGAESGGQGIGFAIPVDAVNQIVPMIIRGGGRDETEPSVKVGMGVLLAPASVSQLLGVEGVVIEALTPDGPAARAGLQPMETREGQARRFDLITELDGESIRSLADLRMALDGRGEGEEIVLTIERDGLVQKVAITLEVLGS